MYNAWILEIIEESQRGPNFCRSCSEQTTPVERNGAIWIECSTLERNVSRFGRFRAWGHTSRLLLSAREIAA
jgi:hypothetical protein